MYFDIAEPSADFEAWLSNLPNCVHRSDAVEPAIVAATLGLGEEGYTARLDIQGLLLHALASLARSDGIRATQRPHPKQDEILRVIRYMKESVYASRSVSDFATLAGYSIPHFNQLFRKILGVTPYEYYMRLKMLEARRLLISQQHNTTEIAQRLGFSSASHFCAAFRKAIGTSPTQFATNFQKDNTLSDDI